MDTAVSLDLAALPKAETADATALSIPILVFNPVPVTVTNRDTRERLDEGHTAPGV